jgi:hypothetical protein
MPKQIPLTNQQKKAFAKKMKAKIRGNGSLNEQRVRGKAFSKIQVIVDEMERELRPVNPKEIQTLKRDIDRQKVVFNKIITEGHGRPPTNREKAWLNSYIRNIYRYGDMVLRKKRQDAVDKVFDDHEFDLGKLPLCIMNPKYHTVFGEMEECVGVGNKVTGYVCPDCADQDERCECPAQTILPKDHPGLKSNQP